MAKKQEEKSVKKEHLNKKVLVRIEGWNSGFKNPIGRVIGIIGDINNHDTEINSILYDYGFDPKFPAKVTNSANKINEVISKKEILNRLDLRKTTTFTIDPEDAKDFDDAISYEKIGKTTTRIGVHIADVSHYVRPNTPMDNEAKKRGNSVYLVDRVVPMIPEQLSNVICSLRPHEEKLCFSVIFDINEQGEIIKEWLGKTIILSKHRFTYEDAQQVIENQKGQFSEEINYLDEIAKELKEEDFNKKDRAFCMMDFLPAEKMHECVQ